MRSRLLLVLLPLGLLCSLATAQDHLKAATSLNVASSSIYITHVTVIDTESGHEAKDRTVIMSGERISEVKNSRDAQPPTGAKVVDGTGKYLIAGLWDMHVHIFNQMSHRPPNTWYFPLFVANGVTGVRDLWTKPEDMEQIREWRRLHQQGSLLAPRIAAVGTVVDGPAGAEARNMDLLTLGPTVNVVRTPAEARRFVGELKAAGIDFVKTYSNLPRETFLAIAEEAKKQGMPLAGHVPFQVDAAEASAVGQRSMEHFFQILESSSSKSQELFQVPSREWSSKHEKLMLDTFDEERFRKLVAVLAKNRTYQVPTLVISRVLSFRGNLRVIRNESWLRYISAPEVASWQEVLPRRDREPTEAEKTIQGRVREKKLEVMRRMQEFGVPFMAGSDVGNPYIFPGFSLHDELALLVEAGFTPLQALQTATRNPAAFLGLSDSLGTIEAGKIADLLLLDANPLRDIRNTQKIRAVVANGRYLDRAELDKLLEQAESAAKKN